MVFIFEFFKQLVRSRVDSTKFGVKGKLYSIQSRARSKAASSFNRPIDRAVAKAKSGVKGKVSGVKGKVKEIKPKKERKKMGIFSFFKKKKKEEEEQTPLETEEAQGDEMKTVALNIDSFTDERSKEVLGWVVALTGVHKGRDFRIYNGKNVLGTAVDCDIVLTDPYLSSHHATIRYENGEFTIQDLDSTNGTFLNGKKVYKEKLVDNDTIKVGRIELKFKSLN